MFYHVRYRYKYKHNSTLLLQTDRLSMFTPLVCKQFSVKKNKYYGAKIFLEIYMFTKTLPNLQQLKNNK